MTGGAQRIGQSIALDLAKHGFDVALHCHTSVVEAEETQALIRACGQRAVILRADLALEDQVCQLVPNAIKSLGPLGVLINNASRFDRDEWHDATGLPGMRISSQTCARPLYWHRRSLELCHAVKKAWSST